MPYFSTMRDFLLPSIEPTAQDVDALTRFLLLLEESGVGGRGIANVECEFILHLLGITVGRLVRYYKTEKKPTFWKAPEGLAPQSFKKSSTKKLSKKGKKINQKQYQKDDPGK